MEKPLRYIYGSEGVDLNAGWGCGEDKGGHGPLWGKRKGGQVMQWE